MSRGRWVWDRAAMELIPAEEYYARRPRSQRSDIAAPMVLRDIEPYRSTVDGTWITGRRQHRDHLRAHDLVEVGNERFPERAAAEPAGIEPDLAAAYDMLDGKRPEEQAQIAGPVDALTTEG